MSIQISRIVQLGDIHAHRIWILLVGPPPIVVVLIKIGIAYLHDPVHLDRLSCQIGEENSDVIMLPCNQVLAVDFAGGIPSNPESRDTRNPEPPGIPRSPGIPSHPHCDEPRWICTD